MDNRGLVRQRRLLILIGVVVEVVELASFDLLGHDVGGPAGADARRRRRVHVVQGEVADGRGGVDVDGGVVVLVLVGKCHGERAKVGRYLAFALSLSISLCTVCVCVCVCEVGVSEIEGWVRVLKREDRDLQRQI